MKPAVFALLLLTACGGPSGNTPDAICERQANDDPAVKHLIMLHAGSPAMAFQNPDGVRNARDRAKRECLARLGQRPAGGGVEPIRQPDSAYKGLF